MVVTTLFSNNEPVLGSKRCLVSADTSSPYDIGSLMMSVATLLSIGAPILTCFTCELFSSYLVSFHPVKGTRIVVELSLLRHTLGR